MFDREGRAPQDFLVELWVVALAAVEVIGTGVRPPSFRIKIERRPLPRLQRRLLLFSSSGWHEVDMAGLLPLPDNIVEDFGLP